jgi:hypothetical protein
MDWEADREGAANGEAQSLRCDGIPKPNAEARRTGNLSADAWRTDHESLRRWTSTAVGHPLAAHPSRTHHTPAAYTPAAQQSAIRANRGRAARHEGESETQQPTTRTHGGLLRVNGAAIETHRFRAIPRIPRIFHPPSISGFHPPSINGPSTAGGEEPLGLAVRHHSAQAAPLRDPPRFAITRHRDRVATASRRSPCRVAAPHRAMQPPMRRAPCAASRGAFARYEYSPDRADQRLCHSPVQAMTRACGVLSRRVTFRPNPAPPLVTGAHDRVATR